MTREEENALRYVAGYTCRKVCNKIQSSSLENKDDLIICVNDMCGREVNEEGTEDWLNAIDRGGLWHVNDQTYSLFYTLEYLVRAYFAVHAHTAGSKQALTAILESNEDVRFQWCMITASIDDKDATELLHRLIELYITIRRFSFATSCVEFYKTSHKKSLQKGNTGKLSQKNGHRTRTFHTPY